VALVDKQVYRALLESLVVAGLALLEQHLVVQVELIIGECQGVLLELLQPLLYTMVILVLAVAGVRE